MPTIMKMPKIGVNMTDATIIEWVVKEGDAIKEGDHILDAETDKAVQEITATESGVLGRILAHVGKTVLCQQPIAILTEEGEKLTDDIIRKYTDGSADEKSEDTNTKALKEEKREASPNELSDASSKKSGRVRISPLARKVARDMEIDYTKVLPANPGDRIVKADVLKYAESKKVEDTKTVAGGVKDSIPYTGIRKVIGDRLLESNNTKPAAALTLHADADMLVKWRSKLKKEGRSVSYNALLAVIAAKALKENSIINSKLEDNEIKILKDINIGIAVDTEKGLKVPVIKNAEKKGVLEVSDDFSDMVSRIKSGKGSADDLTGGTFTITNLGMFEIEQFTPVINPPECCILAAGAIVREAVVDENDNLKAALRMQLTLVFDHRIVDGAPAARFLQRIKHLMEWPMGLME